MIGSDSYNTVGKRDLPFNIKGLTSGTSYPSYGALEQAFCLLPIESRVRMLLRAGRHPDFLQFNKSCNVLRGLAGRLLGTHPRENLIDASVKLEVARICPSAPEAEYYVKEVLSWTPQIRVYLPTGEFEGFPEGGAMPGSGTVPAITANVGATSTARGR